MIKSLAETVSVFVPLWGTNIGGSGSFREAFEDLEIAPWGLYSRDVTVQRQREASIKFICILIITPILLSHRRR